MQSKVINWICLSVVVIAVPCSTTQIQESDDPYPFDPSVDGPQYRFGYFIKDDQTGDYKSQQESRTGDLVKGSYTVAEPNGDLRVVTYTADHKNGFKAFVEIKPGASPVKTKPDAVTPIPVVKVEQELSNVLPLVLRRTGVVSVPFEDSKKHEPEIAASEPQKHEVEDKVEEIEEVKAAGAGDIDKTKTDEDEIDSTTVAPEVVTEEVTTEVSSSTTAKPESTTAEVKIEHLAMKVKSPEEPVESSRSGVVCAVRCMQIKDEEPIKNLEEGDREGVEVHNEPRVEEGRAHIPKNKDKVQLEMEQVIRAEMEDPVGVKLGIPLSHRHNLVGNLPPLTAAPVGYGLRTHVPTMPGWPYPHSAAYGQVSIRDLMAGLMLNQGGHHQPKAIVNPSILYPSLQLVPVLQPSGKDYKVHPAFSTGLAVIIPPPHQNPPAKPTS